MADRPHRPRAAAVAATGTGQRPVRPVPWAQRAVTVPTRARGAMAVDQPRPPVRSWICGSRSCGLRRVATTVIRADRVPATADIPARLLRATADLATEVRAEHRATVDRATADRAVGGATEVAVLRAAADIIQRPVAVDIPPVAVAAAPVEVVDTPAVAVDIRVVAAIPAAEDMAEVIAKKLGDVTSLREAAT